VGHEVRASTVTRKPPTDLAASVRERLRQVAAKRRQEPQLVLTRYGVERLLYRLSRTPAGERFILKGAVLFYIWEGEIPRPTRDVDFLGYGEASPKAVAAVFREVCGATVEPDGLSFMSSSVRAAQIRDRQEYGGVRVKLTAMLGRARVPLQIDVGFGDAVTPGAEVATFPALLDFPAPRVRAYPTASVVAEKFQAMVALGIANTRMKDFYDLYRLSENQDFDGETLAAAIRATFDRRGTVLPSDVPLAFAAAFATDAEKQAQWSAFLKRGHLDNAPETLATVTERLGTFLLPPAGAEARREVFVGQGRRGGGGRRGEGWV
jgi:nucleotidyltransferase AbiEii toxin of type IV toxin-antitoxin system